MADKQFSKPKMKWYLIGLMFIASLIGISTCEKIFEVKNKWDTGFQGEINIPVKEETKYGWKLQIKFHKPIQNFEIWVGKLQSFEQGHSGSQYTYVNFPHNKVLEQSSKLKVEFNGGFVTGSDPEVPEVTVKFQNKILFSDYFDVNNAAATISTTDIVYILNSLTKRSTTTLSPFTTTTTKQIHTFNHVEQKNNNNDNWNSVDDINEINNRRNEIQNSNDKAGSSNNNGDGGYDESELENEEGSGAFPVSTPSPGLRRARPTKYPYIRAIHKSLLFYEAQRSGTLPPDNRVSWRGDSALSDKGDYGEDLTGGYYDAGDHMKFGFPMAFSMTTLAWGLIEYWEAYQQAGELENALKALKWGVDFIMKAHVGSYIFYGQVGLGDKDHKYWGRPEDMNMERPAFKITAKNPGSDLAAESSAALSACSLAFQRSGLEPYALPGYLKKIKKNAESLYDFANRYRGKYHHSIKDAEPYYKSADYLDEITWAVAWLYRSTGHSKYLREAEGKYQNWGQFQLPIELRFSWDDKTAGLQVLLSQLTDGLKRINYLNTAKTYCEVLRTKRSLYTPKGLLFMDEWSPLRYAANAAFICLMVSDQGGDSRENLDFARQQIHYMLGDTGRSYVVGYGRNYPKQPHHRASSCPPDRNSCGWQDYQSPKPNPSILEGALVGGPNGKDVFADIRKNYKSLEVTLDHNSCFQGAVAGLLQRSLVGISRPTNRSHEPWYKEPVTTTARPTFTTTRSNGISRHESLILIPPVILTTLYLSHCNSLLQSITF